MMVTQDVGSKYIIRIGKEDDARKRKKREMEKRERGRERERERERDGESQSVRQRFKGWYQK